MEALQTHEHWPKEKQKNKKLAGGKFERIYLTHTIYLSQDRKIISNTTPSKVKIIYYTGTHEKWLFNNKVKQVLKQESQVHYTIKTLIFHL